MTKPILREMPKGRALVFDAKDGSLVKIEHGGGPFWTAVELDQWGGFRRHLYDGKVDGSHNAER